MSLVLQSSGGGQITIQEPTTASNFTQDLPAVTGNVVIDSATQTLTNKSIAATQLTGTIAAARLPAGSVLQVVSTAKTDTFSESVAAGAISGNVTGLTAVITPATATNKVLINVTVVTSCPSNPVTVLLYINNSVSTFIGDAAGSRIRSSVSGNQIDDNQQYVNNFTFLHSPASTSAQTYSIRLNHASGVTRIIYVNRSVNDADNISITRTASSITAMEIAA
jgi:hypothetical protein